LAESRRWDDSIDDVEALVRSARHYVRASDDLRPRVLEMAGAQCREQLAQRCIRRVAVVTVLLAAFMTAGRHDLFGTSSSGRSALFSAELENSLTRVIMPATGDGHSSWSEVEAFTDLRQCQAEALRLAF
jgi:hypothetical protein